MHSHITKKPVISKNRFQPVKRRKTDKSKICKPDTTHICHLLSGHTCLYQVLPSNWWTFSSPTHHRLSDTASIEKKYGVLSAGTLTSLTTLPSVLRRLSPAAIKIFPWNSVMSHKDCRVSSIVDSSFHCPFFVNLNRNPLSPQK